MAGSDLVSEGEWTAFWKEQTKEYFAPTWKSESLTMWPPISADTLYDPIGMAVKAGATMKKKTVNLPPPTPGEDDNYLNTGLSWSQLMFALTKNPQYVLPPEPGQNLVTWIKEIAELAKANQLEPPKKPSKKPDPPTEPEDFNRFDIDI